MKKLTNLAVIFMLMLLFALASYGQSSATDIISKDNVSVAKIKGLFENAFYDIKETTSTYVQIKDVFNIYIDVDNDGRYITYSVNWPINDNFTLQDKYDLLNKIGRDVLLVTPYYSSTGSSLIIKTTLWLEGGTTAKNIILTEKIFVKALNLVLDKDSLRIIK
jgi:hypothetical protein